MMASPPAFRILHLAFDLSDAAVHKRAAMLLSGGAQVTLAGFRRVTEPVVRILDCPAVDLGRTFNGRFILRIFSVLRVLMTLRRYDTLFTDTDLIIARNLEMLAIGAAGRAFYNPSAVLVYECLDIHRLLLDPGIVGGVLRRLEGCLTQHAQALITSSPAFVRHYFRGRSRVRLPIKLVENKVLSTPQFPPPAQTLVRPQGLPWRIGWFGIIRCSKSLDILAQLVTAFPGKVEVVIRGRPALDQFKDFHGQIEATPGLRFEGPYKNPDDLAMMYGGVHFTWAVDMFEEGLNSAWLLPNRLYEGGACHAVPIARATDESGHFLRSRGLGVLLGTPLAVGLQDFFQRLTPDYYTQLARAAAGAPAETWIDTPNDCAALVRFLKALKIRKKHITQESYKNAGNTYSA